MSRIRMGAVLALAAGILITTGGCSSSATAPEAATKSPTADGVGAAAVTSPLINGGGRTEP